jgi:hypothetical protein
MPEVVDPEKRALLVPVMKEQSEEVVLDPPRE